MSQPLICGEIHYFRVPKPLWRDRLLKLKRSGANCVSTYIPWNWHQPSKDQLLMADGHIDWYTPSYFSRSLRSYLEMASELELKVVARPGPYICSEWDGGGHPSWLYSECQKLRSLDQCYFNEAVKWYDKILPLISEFAEKGTVPVVQVENEYFWGNQEYIERLSEVASRYLHVRTLIVTNEDWFLSRIPNTIDDYPTPWSFSTFEEKVKRYVNSQPGLFKMFMELQGGWFSSVRHGRAPTDRLSIPAEWTELLLKIAFIYGIDNFNIYMFHGGSNPGYYTGKYITSTYDYDASIREWGELSQRYYNVKRFFTLLSTMWKPLSVTKPTESPVASSSTCGRVLARRSDDATVLLLLNEGDYPCYMRLLKDGEPLPSTGSTRIPPRYAKLILMDTRLPDSEFKLEYSTLEPLLYTNINGSDILVLYGELGEEFETSVSASSVFQRVVASGKVDVNLRGNNATIKGSIDRGDSIIALETVDNKRLVVVTTSKRRAERTWLLNSEKNTLVMVSNLYYVSEIRVNGRNIEVEVELDEDSCGGVLLLAPRDLESISINGTHLPMEKVFDGVYLVHIPGSMCKQDDLIQETVDVVEIEEDPLFHYPEKVEPLSPLERLGYYENGLYVYRVDFDLTAEDISSLKNGVIAITGVYDYAIALLNKSFMASGYHLVEASASALLKEGTNELDVIVESTGHPNDGIIYVPNGIAGGIYLGLVGVIHLAKWKRIPHKPDYGPAFDMTEFISNPREVQEILESWRTLQGEETIELNRPGLYVTELKIDDTKARYVFDPGQGFYTNYYYRALLFVNRRYLGPVIGPVDITEHLTPGVNEIAVYVEYAYLAPVIRVYERLIKGKWTVQRGTKGLVDKWFLGARSFNSITRLPLKLTGKGGKVYWVKATITLNEEPTTHKPLKIRVKSKGLRMLVYVNGNFIGRIYDDSPFDELYIPEPALKKGINNVVLLCAVADNSAVLESIEVSNYYAHRNALIKLELPSRESP